MDVLIVAPQPVYTPRGTPLSVYHRANVVAELGVSSVLLTYETGADPDIPGLRIVRIPGIPFLRPAVIGPSWGKILRDVLMVVWTVALLVRHRPAVVHAHEEAVFWCRALRGIFGYRLVYDMHSSLPQQLRSFEFSDSRVLIGLFRILEDWTLRGSDAVITISPALARHAVSRMPHPGRHTLIENSILDPVRLSEGTGEAEAPDEVGFDDAGGPVVFYGGSFESYQGIGLLIEAFALARARVPRSRLVLAGGTSEQIERYRALAASRGVAEACHFLGRVAQPAVRRMASEADVVTSPRTVGTNTPLKIYELLASGRPLVATRTSSHTQVLDGTVCFLADPEPESLARALLDALLDPAGARQRASAALDLFEERYSRDAYVAKMRRVLERVGLGTIRDAEVVRRAVGSPHAAGHESADGRRSRAIAS